MTVVREYNPKGSCNNSSSTSSRTFKAFAFLSVGFCCNDYQTSSLGSTNSSCAPSLAVFSVTNLSFWTVRIQIFFFCSPPLSLLARCRISLLTRMRWTSRRSLQKGHLGVRRMTMRQALQTQWSCPQMRSGLKSAPSQRLQQMLQQPCYEVEEQYGVKRTDPLSGSFFIAQQQIDNLRPMKRLAYLQFILMADQRLLVFTACLYVNYMSKLKFDSASSQLTTPAASRQKYVSPFPLAQCPSPLQNRLANSPLHVPLAIALKKLVSAGEDNCSQGASTSPLFRGEVENIKNVLQEFAESLYLTLERELYSKFNVEMKRIILRYRDVERLMGKVQQKITANADLLENQHLHKAQRMREKRIIEELEESKKEFSNQLAKAKQRIASLLIDNSKLERENKKLATIVQKLETILLKRMEDKENKPHISNVQPQAGKYSFPNHQKRSQINPDVISDESVPFYSDLSSQLTSSYVLNINQLPPTQSPIRSRRQATLHPQLNKQINTLNIKKCYF